MIILKSVIQYTTTNGCEATWVDRTVTPATTDEEGNDVPEVVTDVQVKCHSYADTQMQMFRDDAAAFGTPLTDYEAIIADIESKIVPYVPPQPTVADFVNALTLHLDAVAQQRQYDNRITCMVRAGFPGPFQAEGLAFAAWADTCNATAYALLAEVQAGTRPLPETTQALIDVMPPMVWPT